MLMGRNRDREMAGARFSQMPPGYQPPQAGRPVGPPTSRYPQQYEQAGYRQPPPGREPIPPEESGLILTILGIVAALAAVMVFVSTFIPWVSASGVSMTGSGLMTASGQGNFVIRWGWGGILFTGLFSLLIGALMIIPVILLLLNKRAGASWAIVVGVLGFFIALVNVIMIYATYKGANAGAGLWMFLVGAIIMLVSGIVGLRFSINS